MRIASVFALICIVAGCGAAKPVAVPSPKPSSNTAKNGKMIFMMGKDAEGFQIMAQRAPLRTSCAACHKANGSGGVRLPGGAVSADLRAGSLVSGRHQYNLTLLERAISTGIDNEGKPLDPVMPRWRMTNRDLHDVAAYVLTLR